MLFPLKRAFRVCARRCKGTQVRCLRRGSGCLAYGLAHPTAAFCFSASGAARQSDRLYSLGGTTILNVDRSRGLGDSASVPVLIAMSTSERRWAHLILACGIPKRRKNVIEGQIVYILYAVHERGGFREVCDRRAATRTRPTLRVSRPGVPVIGTRFDSRVIL